MEKMLFRKGLVFLVIVLFVGASVTSSIGGYSEETDQIGNDVREVCESQEDVVVTCRTFGFPGEPSQEVAMPLEEAEFLYSKLKELQIEIACDPLSDKTHELQHDIITLADDYGLLSVSLGMIQSRFNPSLSQGILPLPSKGSELFCTFVSTGSGSSLPIIVLPRFIPILLTPIPRVFMWWNAQEAVTSCGGLLSGTGFIAYGQQTGIALGFWGIGFTFSLPPFMNTYGLAGYALFARVNAEEIEFYPPNRAPVISSENPVNGAEDISVSLSELSFKIEDADGDRMSYSVTTDPYIGSGSGNNKKNGFYSVSVSGLEHDKIYSWTVEVTDGKDTTVQQFGFFAEAGPPFDPFDEGWQYRKEITIDHTQVADNLTNFPVLISTVDTDLRDKTQDDGDDILFMDGLGVAQKLYHEIEQYDGSSGELVVWVNVTDVASNLDTVLYMYYGNPSSCSQQVPERVWDSDYIHVWHMNGNDIIYDSIGSNDGTNHGTDGITGKIYDARDFISANSDYVDFGDMTQPADGSLTTITIENWIFVADNTKNQALLNKHDNCPEPDKKGYLSWVLDGKPLITVFQKTYWPSHWTNQECDTVEVFNDTWTHVAYAVQLEGGTDIDIYVNGIEKPTTKTTQTADATSFKNLDISDEIGRYRGECGRNYYDFKLDETRVSKIKRSSAWISTEYNNQNDPSSFLSFGPEETAH